MAETSELMKEIARAIPSTRHAELLFTAAAETLGERGWRVDRDKTSTLYSRDPDQPELVAPWPLVRFRDGEHVGLGQLQLEADDPYGIGGWKPEPDPAPETAAAPSNLRGQRRGELTIGWGQALRICYDDDGVPIDISQAGNGVTSDFQTLLEAILAPVRDGRGLVGVADHVAALDAPARGPARMLPAAGEGEAAWRAALLDLRRALWTRRLPSEPCWIGVVVGDGATADWSTDRDELLGRLAQLADGRAIAVTPLPDEPERPAAYIDAGFRRWLPMIGGCGVVAHALLRDEPGCVTLVGSSLLTRFEPAAIVKRMDEIEADAPPTPVELEIALASGGPPLRWLSVGASFGEGYKQTSCGRSPAIDGSQLDADHHHRWAYRYRGISGEDES